MLLRRASAGVVVSYGRRPSFRACLKKAGATADTYAAEIVLGAYEWYVVNVVDLKREYKLYYKPEYPTIYAFLYHKFGFNKADIRALKTDLDSDRYVGLATASVRYGGGLTGYISYDGKDDLAARLLGASWEEVG
jgi:hypothetical protein